MTCKAVHPSEGVAAASPNPSPQLQQVLELWSPAHFPFLHYTGSIVPTPGHPSAMPQHLPQDTGPLSQCVLQLKGTFSVSERQGFSYSVLSTNVQHYSCAATAASLSATTEPEILENETSPHTLLLRRAAWWSSCFISRYQEKYPRLRVQLSQFLLTLMLLFHLESLEKFGFSFLFGWYFKLIRGSRDKAVTHLVYHP